MGRHQHGQRFLQRVRSLPKEIRYPGDVSERSSTDPSQNDRSKEPQCRISHRHDPDRGNLRQNLMAREKTPETWEDYLKPSSRGKRSWWISGPLKLQPWFRLGDWKRRWILRANSLLRSRFGYGVAQEPWLHCFRESIPVRAMGRNYRSVRRSQLKDRTGTIAYKMLEPVPVRPSQSLAITATSSRPHAALLWLEFQASAEGQKIVDQFEPFGGSVHAPGSIQGQEIKGKKLWLGGLGPLHQVTRLPG